MEAAAIEAATEAFVVLNRCGKVLNLPASLRLPLPNLNDEVLRTKPVVEEFWAMEAAETVVFSAS